MAVTSRERFNWEEAVVQDRELQRIDALVKLTVSKLPDQPPLRANEGRGGSRFEPAPPPAPFVKLEPGTFLFLNQLAREGGRKMISFCTALITL